MRVSRFSFALADSLANEEMKEADGWMDGFVFEYEEEGAGSDDRFRIGFAGGGLVLLSFYFVRSFVRESVGRSVTKSLGKSRARNFLGGRER
jgi:hypothetical protein